MTQRKPLIWALQTARVGDNAQVLELCSRLGADVVVKQLDLNLLHLLPNWALGARLASLTNEAAGLLVPPWPDLVIAVGKRTAPIARWIKTASGDRTKLVHLGRPRAPLDEFDLIVTTPQYGLPAQPNILEIDLPFAHPRGAPKAEQASWLQNWQDLPRPLIAVVVGGAKFPIRMGASDLRRLAAEANGLARERKGSLVIILSPRTNARHAQAMLQEFDVPYRFYPWGPGKPNPYQAALGLADEFVVTSESASMISEAVYSGKPVNIFELPQFPLFLSWSAKYGLGAVAARRGWLQPPRNIRRISRQLIRKKIVTQLGEKPRERPYFLSNEDIVVNKLKSMLATAVETSGNDVRQHHSGADR